MVHVLDALIPFRGVSLDSPRDIASSIERLQALERSNPRARKSASRIHRRWIRKRRQGEAVMLNVSTVAPFTFVEIAVRMARIARIEGDERGAPCRHLIRGVDEGPFSNAAVRRRRRQATKLRAILCPPRPTTLAKVLPGPTQRSLAPSHVVSTICWVTSTSVWFARSCDNPSPELRPGVPMTAVNIPVARIPTCRTSFPMAISARRLARIECDVADVID
jgi:hypothetical protein